MCIKCVFKQNQWHAAILGQSRQDGSVGSFDVNETNMTLVHISSH